MDIDEYFDLIQRILYRLCSITPRDFWNYSIGECNLMIEESENKEKAEADLDIILNAKLCAVLYNSNGGIDGKPVKIEEFLPKGFLKDNPIVEETPEDKVKKILDRGNLLASRCGN